MWVNVIMKGWGRATGIGTGAWIGDDGGVLRNVDGNKLETVDIVELDGDGGDGDGKGDCS